MHAAAEVPRLLHLRGATFLLNANVQLCSHEEHIQGICSAAESLYMAWGARVMHRSVIPKFSVVQ